MLNKLTVALSAAVMLGAVSTASAAFDNYDPWIDQTEAFSFGAPGYDAMARGNDARGHGGYHARMNTRYDAFAFSPAPARSGIASESYDPWIQHDVNVW